MSKQDRTISGLIRSHRLLLAEKMLYWALWIMPEGKEKVALAKQIGGYFMELLF